jgi:subtilisin family serine protease
MMRIRSSLAVLPVLALVAACSQDAAGPAATEAAAPLLSQSTDGSNRYIVVVKEGANPRSVAAVLGITPEYVYTTAVNGFAGTLNAGQLNALRHNRNVEYVEADGEVRASVVQTGATWGLDRIDQASLPLSTTFGYLNTGLGVRAYIVDTGIRLTHAEVAGRASTGFDAVTAGGTGDDCNGHGTHVAGTVGGTTYGVAKAVSLVAVRVLDCGGSGTNAGVIAGVDWVASNAVLPAVANLSLGGGANTTLDNAVKNAISRGVTFVVAAGNGFFGFAQPACNYSPARVPEAITVGATTTTDAKASYSNYGPCLDIFAPGSGITSSWYTNDTATNTISGTSMASPHVAGVAALYLQSNPGASPATVSGALIAGATLNKVTSAGSGSPNRLLFTAY